MIRRVLRRVSTHIYNRNIRLALGSEPNFVRNEGGRPHARAPTHRENAVCLLLRHQLHASILRAALGGVVRRDEIGLAEALSDQAGVRDALLL